MADTKYEPCPFCGGTNVSVCERDHLHFVMCGNCTAEGPAMEGVGSEGHAVKEWNRRSSSSVSEKEITTYTVDGVAMSPLEYIDYLHGKLATKAAAPTAAATHALIADLAKFGGTGGMKAVNELVRRAQEILAAPTSGRESATPAPTDLSKRLREFVEQNLTPYPRDILAAADEIERYYGGMMAWKKTAEKKDADWNAERMARVNDRCAARAEAGRESAAPAAPVREGDREQDVNLRHAVYSALGGFTIEDGTVAMHHAAVDAVMTAIDASTHNGASHD